LSIEGTRWTDSPSSTLEGTGMDEARLTYKMCLCLPVCRETQLHLLVQHERPVTSSAGTCSHTSRGTRTISVSSNLLTSKRARRQSSRATLLVSVALRTSHMIAHLHRGHVYKLLFSTLRERGGCSGDMIVSGSDCQALRSGPGESRSISFATARVSRH